MAILISSSNAGAQPELLAPELIFSVDFTTRHPELSLAPLKHVNIFMPELLATLKSYRIALQQGGSIALGRGESLASLRLDRSISGLFSTDAPKVIQGPAITWTTLVLSTGPRFDGGSRFQVGDSLIEILDDDLDLIRSGRPWRFLAPWPDTEDCRTELKATETSLRELLDAKLVIHQVLEETESLEDALRRRQILVDQLHEGEQRRTPKAADAGSPAVQSETLPDGASNEAVMLTVANGVPQTDSIGTASGTSGLSESREQRSPAGPVDLGLAPEKAQSGMPRLDFIRKLHRILDEPSNEEAMRWSGDGRSFVLADENKYPLSLLSRLSVASYSSLIRKLYYYGFHKTAGAFHHDRFIRGKPCSISPREWRRQSNMPPPTEGSRPRVKYTRRYGRRKTG